MNPYKLRKQRLFELLPGILSDQPPGSAVATLIEAMASALGQMDADLQQVMRCHWVAFAECSDEGSDFKTALDRLGALMNLPRQQWETGEAYRRRLRYTVTVLTWGLTTPRALLTLAASALDSELCPHLHKKGDTTYGVGLPAGSLKRCSVCNRLEVTICPMKSKQVFEATLTDNPVSPRSLSLNTIGPGKTFSITSRTLVPDRPQVLLQAKSGTVIYPAIQNRNTREIMLYSGQLAPGDLLRVLPCMSQEELSPYDTQERIGHHAWYMSYPMGNATVTKQDGTVRDVSDSIYYMSGYAFDRAHFALENADEPRFGTMEQVVRTPRIRCGKDTWVYRIYTRKDIKTVAGNESDILQNEAPEQADSTPVDLQLRWWVRPLATFRLRIPKSEILQRAENTGALSFVRDLVESARAAGVTALIDFPEPVYQEQQAVNTRSNVAVRNIWPEPLSVDDRLSRADVTITQQQQHDLGEVVLTFGGIFDVTRFNRSHIK